MAYTKKTWVAGEVLKAVDLNHMEDGIATVQKAAANSSPSKSASGEVVTVSDGAEDMVLKSLVLNLVPHQSGSGDPSPSNIRPITGYDAVNVTRTGKNLLPPLYATTSTSNGITWVSDGNGTVTANGTATADSSFGFIPTNTYLDLPDTSITYVANGCPSGGSTSKYYLLVYKYLDGDSVNSINDLGSGITVNPTDGTFNQIRIVLRIKSGQTVNNLTFRPMLSLASVTDDTYEPYQGTTYPISLSSAGTVYGGTLDVTTGELVVDRAHRDMGDLTWGTNDGSYFYSSTLTDKALGITNLISDQYQTVNASSVSGMSDGQIKGAGSAVAIYVKDARYTTASDFKTAMSGHDVVYELAIPLTYQLTPTEVTTLLGDNTIWMDAEGTMDVQYHADINAYIDSRINATRSIIAGVETSNTATTNYSIGDLLIVGDTLYKATAAITSGTTIAPGTNVAATTVAEQLLALASA